MFAFLYGSLFGLISWLMFGVLSGWTVHQEGGVILASVLFAIAVWIVMHLAIKQALRNVVNTSYQSVSTLPSSPLDHKAF